MSAMEIVAEIRKLPLQEQREVVERVWQNLPDDDLTPEQIAELERRSEDALGNPGRGKPAEQVFAEIRDRLTAKK